MNVFVLEYSGTSESVFYSLEDAKEHALNSFNISEWTDVTEMTRELLKHVGDPGYVHAWHCMTRDCAIVEHTIKGNSNSLN